MISLRQSPGPWQGPPARATGPSTLRLARAWLGEPLGIESPPRGRDLQGIHPGGSNRLLAPRAVCRFGRMIDAGGMLDGRRVVAESWIATSWQPRPASRWTGHRYGHGWFMTETGGHPHYYGWGYGGQMLHVVPALDLTSDPTVRSREAGYMAGVRALVAAAVAEG